MVFSSLEFIFIFLPIFLIIYFASSKKYKNYILLIGSIIFYVIGAWGHPHFVLLLALSILVNYITGKKLHKAKNKKVLVIGIVYNLFWLVLFKYSDFIISIICNMGNIHIEPLNFLLPIGISFYTFQSISYIVDVYNEKCKPANSIIRYSMYVLMFPQLISGPIVTYKDINKELNKRNESLTNIIVGSKYFVLGLSFKVLLANKIGCLWNDINMIGLESISTGLAWLSVIAYSLQIYFDFCGYSFMAVGLGKIMGFTLPINFETPYLSTSMTEFFRRWHISLGNWFKNYVYIPLGGNRKGKPKIIFNLLVVWILTGLWHGSNYNFILWGLFIWVVIVLEKLWLKKYLDKYKILGHLYMFVLIPIMWSIFAITDIEQLGILLTKLFSYSNGLYDMDFIKYLNIYGVLILVGIMCTTKIPKKLFITKQNTWLQTIILLLIFSMSIYYLYIGLNNPFLYFSF